jgi:hypothetical protein
MRQPDPKLHQQISIVKSAVRILAGATLMSSQFWWSGLLFILAELLGILEELV